MFEIAYFSYRRRNSCLPTDATADVAKQRLNLRKNLETSGDSTLNNNIFFNNYNYNKNNLQAQMWVYIKQGKMKSKVVFIDSLYQFIFFLTIMQTFFTISFLFLSILYFTKFNHRLDMYSSQCLAQRILICMYIQVAE